MSDKLDKIFEESFRGFDKLWREMRESFKTDKYTSFGPNGESIAETVFKKKFEPTNDAEKRYKPLFERLAALEQRVKALEDAAFGKDCWPEDDDFGFK